MRLSKLKQKIKDFLCSINIHFPDEWVNIRNSIDTDDGSDEWCILEESKCKNCNKQLIRDLTNHIH